MSVESLDDKTITYNVVIFIRLNGTATRSSHGRLFNRFQASVKRWPKMVLTFLVVALKCADFAIIWQDIADGKDVIKRRNLVMWSSKSINGYNRVCFFGVQFWIFDKIRKWVSTFDSKKNIKVTNSYFPRGYLTSVIFEWIKKKFIFWFYFFVVWFHHKIGFAFSF